MIYCHDHATISGRCGLMVSALDTGWSDPGSTLDWGTALCS